MVGTGKGAIGLLTAVAAIGRLVDQAQKEFPDAFEKAREVMAGFGGKDTGITITETETGVSARVVIPGVKKESISVNVQKNVVTVSAEEKQEVANSGDGAEQTIRVTAVSIRKLERSFTLPFEPVVDKTEAKYEDGILMLTLYKTAAPAGSTIKVA